MDNRVVTRKDLYIIGNIIVEYSNDPNDHNILYIFLETFSRVYFLISFVSFSSDVLM